MFWVSTSSPCWPLEESVVLLWVCLPNLSWQTWYPASIWWGPSLHFCSKARCRLATEYCKIEEKTGRAFVPEGKRGMIRGVVRAVLSSAKYVPVSWNSLLETLSSSFLYCSYGRLSWQSCTRSNACHSAYHNNPLSAAKHIPKFFVQFLSRPFVVGERIDISFSGGGKFMTGYVEQVAPMRTILRTDSCVPVTIPNKASKVCWNESLLCFYYQSSSNLVRWPSIAPLHLSSDCCKHQQAHCSFPWWICSRKSSKRVTGNERLEMQKKIYMPDRRTLLWGSVQSPSFAL